MVKVEVKREEHFIYFSFPDDREDIRYDLKLLQMQKYTRKGWIGVKKCYKAFHNVNTNDLVSDDPKFINMIKKVSSVYPNCSSVSTFISRLNTVLIGEQYEAEGIEYQCSSYRGYGNNVRIDIITKPLNFYDKQMIKLFKQAKWYDDYYRTTTKFKVDLNFENNYSNNKELFNRIAHVANTLELDDKEVYSLLQLICRDDFRSLITQYNYDIKALINYIFKYIVIFEGLKPSDAINELHDYYSMAFDIGRNVKKYPKYLRSMHDILSANYKAHKKDYDLVAFQNKINLGLEYKNHKFLVSVPKEPKEITQEGTSLNHCVHSYVDKIIKGETYIVFMRLIEIPEESLVTVEVKNNAITQARGSCNRDLLKEENEFLLEYSKAKNLKVDVKIPDYLRG